MAKKLFQDAIEVLDREIARCEQHILLLQKSGHEMIGSTIPLTRGFVAMVDDQDVEELSRFKWYVKTGVNDRTYYAHRSIEPSGTVSMHRFIMSAPKGLYVDHIDGNGLNNRRANLRVVTHSQNHQNRTRKRRDCSSKYKGVQWHKDTSKWVATICVNGKSKHLGLFACEEDARDAYALAAVTFFGEFAAPRVERCEMDDAIANERAKVDGYLRAKHLLVEERKRWQ